MTAGTSDLAAGDIIPFVPIFNHFSVKTYDFNFIQYKFQTYANMPEGICNKGM